MSSGRPIRPGAIAVVPAVIFALLLGSACTFERRTEVIEEDTAADSGLGAFEVTLPEAGTEASARATVRLFRESVAVGDLSLALALLVPEATLVDPLVGDAAESATRGELVLELRRRYATGMRLEELSAEITLLGGASSPEAVALVVSDLAMLQERDDGLGEQVGNVHETAILASTPQGWRIRHLHRSSSPLD